MAPSRCCTAAIAAPVALTSSAVKMPATSGTQKDGRGRCELSGWRMLVRVDDEALADQRIQGLISEPGNRRLAHDVPDQQPVIAARERVIIVVHADRALEPPVGRVQRVGMVMT